MNPLLSRIRKTWSATGCFLLLVALHGVALPVAAQTVTAANGLSCAGARAGGSLNCTAGEFTATVSITKAASAPDTCTSGEYLMLDGSIGLSDSNADRYNIGFFTGEDGNDPKLTTGSCSVATFPTSPSPWLNLDGNACGDYLAGGVSTPLVQNLRVLCIGNASGQLQIPYVLTYAQNTNTCTGPGDVRNGAPSKCNAGTATVGGIWVLPAITVTDGKSTVTSGEDTTYTVVITNNSGAAMSNLVFKDPLVSGIGVGGVTCSASGATCPASSTVAGMQGAGLTIPSIANGGSVTFTITATLSGSVGATLTNVATVALSGGQTAQASDSNTIIALVPVADYRFDECNQYTGATGEVVDTRGSYPGTPMSSLQNVTPGQIQGYADFSAGNRYVNVPSGPTLANWTISVWFKKPFATSTTHSSRYYNIGSIAGGGDFLYLDRNSSGGAYRWGVYTTGAGGGVTDGTFRFSTLSDGWHHMAIVGNGSTTSLYIDGTYRDQVARKNSGTFRYLGASFDGAGTSSGQSFGTPLDEFKLFGSALSSTQIASIHTNELAGANYDGTVRPLACVSSQICEGFESGLTEWTIDNTGGTDPDYGAAVINSTYKQSGTSSLLMSRDWVRASWSKVIDTTGTTGQLTLGYARGLGGDYPEPGDDLRIEYLNSSSVWTTLATLSGVNSADSGFLNYSGAMPADAKHAGFKLRLTQINGSGNATNNYDQWYIDNVCVPGSAAAVHHLELQSTGSGLTCAASTVTVKACADAGCTAAYTGGISGTLTGTGINWDGSTGGASGAGFAIASGSSSVTKNFQPSAAGSYTLGTSGLSPVTTSATTCNFGSPSCTFTASTAGFIFSSTTTDGAATIPAQVSGTATGTYYLRAVQASTTNPAVCTPAIVSQSGVGVTLGFSCNDPATCQSGNLLTINSTGVPSTGGSVDLDFDANGAAPLTVRYDDVGQITLAASKTLTPFAGGTAVTLTGSSNAFVVKPYDFALSAIQCGDGTANPAATTAAGAKFCKAGDSFSASVTARTAAGLTTKNYGQESSPETVKLTPTLVTGLGLVNTPSLGGSFNGFSAGVASGASFTWNEVGIITLTPSIGDGDYLGAGEVNGTVSGNVGRFYAAKFGLSAGSSITNRADLCPDPPAVQPAGCPASFTYMGEPLHALFTLKALAMDGTTQLQNYSYSATAANNFAKLDPMAAVTAGTGGPLGMGAVDGAATRTPFPPCGAVPAHPCLLPLQATAGTFASGLANVSVPFSLFRGATPTGPFATLEIGAAPQDSDGAILAAYDLDTVNVVAGTNNHAKIGSNTAARFGRLWLGNAYGSDKRALSLPYEVQYWNGNAFVKNTADGLAPFALGNISLYKQPSSLATTPTLDAMTAGAGTITLTAPNAAGSVDVYVNLDSTGAPVNCQSYAEGTTVARSYLSGKWCGTAYDRDPVARATFGIYGGKKGPIYIRENY